MITEILETTPAIERLASLLGEDTDIEQRINSCQAACDEITHREDFDDTRPIELYSAAIAKSRHPSQVRPSISVSSHSFLLKQGRMVGFVTQKHVYGSSVSRLFLGLSMHRHEFAKAPYHLNVIYVDSRPVFFSELTLFENLTFGVDSDHLSDGHTTLDRVLAICDLMDLSKTLCAQIRKDVAEHHPAMDHGASMEFEEHELHNWEALLSIEQGTCLAIARALISDADILCIEHPVKLLRDRKALEVLQVMRRFIRERGVGFSCPKGDRHIKTVLYTSVSYLALEASDEVVVVGTDGFGRCHHSDPILKSIMKGEKVRKSDINNSNHAPQAKKPTVHLEQKRRELGIAS